MDRNSRYIQEVHVWISSCDISQISHYDFNDTNNIKRARKRRFKIKFVDLNSFYENNLIAGVLQDSKMRFDAYGM